MPEELPHKSGNFSDTLPSIRTKQITSTLRTVCINIILLTHLQSRGRLGKFVNGLTHQGFAHSQVASVATYCFDTSYTLNLTSFLVSLAVQRLCKVLETGSAIFRCKLPKGYKSCCRHSCREPFYCTVQDSLVKNTA